MNTVTKRTRSFAIRVAVLSALATAALLLVPAIGEAQDECRCDVAPRVRVSGLSGPFANLQELRFPRARIGVALGGEEQEDHPDGAYVVDVTEGAPAETAGLQAGDVIVAVDGHRLNEPLDAPEERRFNEDGVLAVDRLMALARDWEPGDDVEITYLRDGRESTVSMEAEESEFDGEFQFRMEELGDRMSELGPRIQRQMRPLAEQLRQLESSPGARVWVGEGDGPNSFYFGSGVRGLELRSLNPEMGDYFGTEEGVLVMEVDGDSTLGLEAGDVILSIGERTVDEPRDVRRILGSYDDGEVVRIQVMRHQQRTTTEGTVRD